MVSEEFDELGTSIERLPDVNIAADPTRLEESSRCSGESSAAHQRWLAATMSRANGRKIVRKKSAWIENRCVLLGIVVRETQHYFIYSANAHVEGVDETTCKHLRVSKSLAHLEPCPDCDDNPDNIAGCG
jgi:hypothetical protein